MMIWALSACSSGGANIKGQNGQGSGAGDKAGSPNMEVTENENQVIRKYDINKNKKVDLIKVYERVKDHTGKENLLHVRTEIDLNSDGKIDIRIIYKNNSKVREEFDLDFDGKVDVINLYDDQGFLHKQEYFISSKDPSKPDLFKYYEVIGEKANRRVQLVRKERDSNLDGKIDYWEYWEEGKLVRIGRDTDHNGTVDVWENVGSSQ
jgi:hypothetical protein